MFDNKIDLFIDTVEQKSFSAAAKKNYISQSAVSQAISKLESELGIVLFNRSSYRPSLTAAGKYYYEELKQIKSAHDKIVKNSYRLSLNETKIRIGISNKYEKKHVPIIVSDFKKNHDVKVDIKRRTPLECLELLRQKKVQICFGMKYDFEEYSNIECVPIHNAKVCIAVSKDHPLASFQEVNIQDIVNEPVIVLNGVVNERTQEIFMKSFKLDGFIPDIIKECDDIDEFFMSIRLGEGIGYTIEEFVYNEDGIVAIPIKGSHHKSELAIGYLKDESNENVLELTKEIQEYFKRL